jgi:L-fuconolactonase
MKQGQTRRTVLGALGASALPAAPTYRILDSHTHVWVRDPKYPWAKETAEPPNYDATPEMLIEKMRANGVERTVILQVIHYRWDNSYLADVLKRYPNLFQGVARVDPNNPAAPDHLSGLVEEQGFRGVRISPAANAAGDWISGPLMPALWKRCESLKVPLVVLAPATRLPDIARLVDRFPGLTVVIDHMADSPLDQPRLLDPLLALKRYPNVYAKITHTWTLTKQAYPYRDSFAQVKRIYDAFGAQRIMWGTDWPLIERYTTYDKILAFYRRELDFLTEDDKTWVLARTVERIWPFA